MASIVALITARGGSKSLPRKNVQLLGGKPLITWTIRAALDSAIFARVIVSTDDEEIARISRQYGADVPFLRPTELARDDSPHIIAGKHALNWLRNSAQLYPEYVMLLQPTSPFRTVGDIIAAKNLAEVHNAIAVVSVVEAKPHPSKTYRLTSDGTLADFVPTTLAYRRRQDLPPAFADNGAIYLNRSDSLLRDGTFIPPGTIPYVMPAERSIDIDTPWDLVLANLAWRGATSCGNTTAGCV